ncbi:MAG: membrane protein insertase YidC [Clostridia bacterium]|nr:membrane protein insertase YidC [Clostridia bacterium]
MLASWTADMWSPIINLFSFIPSYGFMIIVFTICLKIILSPLDYWQKKVSRSSMMKQQKLQPEIAKLQKKYGQNTQMLNQKTMELYKREGYNVIGSCLSMFVNLALTLFIFFTLFTGLQGISQEKTYKQYLELEQSYNTVFYEEFRAQYGLTALEDNSDINEKLNELINSQITTAQNALIEDGVEEPTEAQILAKARDLVFTTVIQDIVSNAQDSAAQKYEEIKDNWLWIDNIWRPDTYVSGYPAYNDFKSMANINGQLGENEARKSEITQNYDIVTAKIQGAYSSWNGYFILVVLAGVVTYLSFVITQMTSSKKKKEQELKQTPPELQQNQKQNQMQGATKIMKFIMPVIMIIFTISYSAAFALYIVTNSLMSLIISFISLKIMEKFEKNGKNTNKKTKKVEYSR